MTMHGALHLVLHASTFTATTGGFVIAGNGDSVACRNSTGTPFWEFSDSGIFSPSEGEETVPYGGCGRWW